jgi:hypothetical protein
MNPAWVIVKFDDGRRVSLAREKAKSALRVGGVWTGDSAQGQGWDGAAVVAVTGNETRQWDYSVFTRGRQAPIPVALTDDPNHEMTEEEANEEARQVMRRVFNHDGLARTVDEMAKAAALDFTVPRTQFEMPPWMRAGGTDESGAGAKAAEEKKAAAGEKARRKKEAGGGIEALFAEAAKAAEEKKAAAGLSSGFESRPRCWRGGFFYRENGVWLVDEERRAAQMWALMSWSPSCDLGHFNIESPREVEPGSGEYYDPGLDIAMLKRRAKEEAERAEWFESHPSLGPRREYGSGKGQSQEAMVAVAVVDEVRRAEESISEVAAIAPVVKPTKGLGLGRRM